MKPANDRAPLSGVVETARFSFNLPATLYARGGGVACRLINLSREGFRVCINPGVALVGEQVWLAVDSWPRLPAYVLWLLPDRAGCAFAAPLAERDFGRFLKQAVGEDRLGQEVLI